MLQCGNKSRIFRRKVHFRNPTSPNKSAEMSFDREKLDYLGLVSSLITKSHLVEGNKPLLNLVPHSDPGFFQSCPG